MTILILILNGLLILYVIFSLSSIKHKLNLIIQHLNIKDFEYENVSDEEIEQELENHFE